MRYKATSRYVHVAPSKARQVVAHIRGAPVTQAQRLLQVSPKGIAPAILKTLNSAVANANYADDSLHADDLRVAAAVVEEGPTLKRYQFRAMGRTYRVRKRTSHITIAVEPAQGAATKSRGRRPARRSQQDREG